MFYDRIYKLLFSVPVKRGQLHCTALHSPLTLDWTLVVVPKCGCANDLLGATPSLNAFIQCSLMLLLWEQQLLTLLFLSSPFTSTFSMFALNIWGSSGVTLVILLDRVKLLVTG